MSCTDKHIEDRSSEPDENVNLSLGKAIVKFDDSLLALIECDLEKGSVLTRSGEVNDVVDRLGVVSMERLFPDAGKFEARTRTEGLHRWYKVTYDSSMSFTKASEELAGIEGIGVVEPIRHIHPLGMFNDPKLNLQWSYFNDGTLTSKHTENIDINVRQAWEDGWVGNEDVIVAVVDGGIDQNHRDLAPNCIGGYNFNRRSEEIIPHDHGTHVAGTVAAVNNNNIGVCGIAGGDLLNGIPGVKLLSCQIFESDPQNPDKTVSEASGAEAIKWAADNGAIIAQNSWGYVFETYRDAVNTKIEQSLQEAIDYFIKYAGVDENGNQIGPMRGGVVFFAAGNDGWNTDPIGKYEPVVSVGSVTSYGERADYSNYGNWVDIAAPGGSYEFNECAVLSTLPGDTYGYMIGTSMACPHVSGAAALIVSKYGGIGFTSDDLKHRLLEGANYDIISKSQKIGPLLNVTASLSDLPDTTPERVEGLSVSTGMKSIGLRWLISANSEGICPESYRIYLSDKCGILKSLDVSSVPKFIDVRDVQVGAKKEGDEIIYRFNNLDFGVTYELGVVAFDKRGRFSEMSEILQVSMDDNKAPVLQLKSAINFPIVIGAHNSIHLVYEASDPEGQDLAVYIYGAGESLTYEYDDVDRKINVIINGDGFHPGRYSAKIVAVDELGSQNSLPLIYELSENIKPSLLKENKDMMLNDIGKPYLMNLGEFFTDADGGKLSFNIRISDDQIVDYDLDNDILTLLPLSYGISNIAIRANDSYAFSETMVFKVLVRNRDDAVLLYPNPVIDDLCIQVLEEATYKIEIYAPGGSLVALRECLITPFEDMKIDMSDYDPGNYGVIVSTSDIYYERNIVKL